LQGVELTEKENRMTTAITGDYVLRMAEQIERNGAEFYGIAAVHAPEPARPVLLELATAEAQHQQQFHDIRSRLSGKPAGAGEPDQEVTAYLQGLLAGKFFESTADPASYFDGSETYRDIVLTAIRLEKEIIAFYEGVKLVLGDKDSRSVVELIIRAEMGHITTLARQLDVFDKV